MDVAVLEPREVLRCGLAAMLGRLGEVGRIECHSATEEVFIARKARGAEHKPDIVIVSYTPGEDVVTLARSAFPASRVLELVPSAEPGDVEVAAKTRADGYLMLNDITEATLEDTLRALMRGEIPMPHPVANYLLECCARKAAAPPPPIQPYFSPRENDVVALLLEGLGNQQIADKLGISLHSAKRHVSAVLSKANSPSRAHFVAQMLRDDVHSQPTVSRRR